MTSLCTLYEKLNLLGSRLIINHVRDDGLSGEIQKSCRRIYLKSDHYWCNIHIEKKSKLLFAPHIKVVERTAYFTHTQANPSKQPSAE